MLPPMHPAASTPVPTQQINSGRQRATEVRTIVFTDIIGSTRLKQVLGDMEGSTLIEQHHEVLRMILAEVPDGMEITNTGDGFLLLFSRPSNAVAFALRLQKTLRDFNEQAAMKVEDRIGIHAGEVIMEREASGAMLLLGIQVDTASRVTSLASGDQILLTRFVFDNARQMLRPADVSGIDQLSWVSHGHYEVDGVEEPLEVCEVGEKKAARLSAPTESAKARRRTQSDGTLVLGWRPAAGEQVTGTAWRLERKLGEGGFGEVWLARHIHLHQPRVFKFCFFADRARSLRREATLFRVLSEQVREHPNIVRIGDVFLESPPYYLSMEYVEGEDLIKWCETPRPGECLKEEEKIEIVAQIADGLAAAHAAGVLHRDVKPSNILIGTAANGSIQPKLTDFGIGQVVSQEILAGMTGLGFTRTIMGSDKESASGTRLYMAPELLAGKGASPQSDIYSLGVVLYQLLIDDFHRPVTTDWSRRLSDPLLRNDLERCFAGDPAERFASAAEMAASLRALPERRGQEKQAKAEAARREKAAYRRGIYRAASVAGVVLAVVLAVAGTALFFARKARDNNRRNEAILDFMLQDLRAKLEPSGRREVLLAVVERVLENQRELNAVGASASGRVREANALILRGDIELYRGQPAEARQDYLSAQQILAGVLARDGSNASARRFRATLGYKLSDIANMVGDNVEAAGLAEESRVALQQLLDETEAAGARIAATERAQLQRDTGMAVTKAASYKESEDEERLLREGLKLREEASAAQPEQVQWRFEVAQSWFIIGRAARVKNDFQKATEAFENSQRLVAALLDESPSNAGWRHLLSQLALEQAELATPWPAAAELLEIGIGTLEAVRIADPGNAWWQEDLAEAHLTYAGKLAAAGDNQAADEHRQEAAALWSALAEAHPDVVIWRPTEPKQVLSARTDTANPPDTAAMEHAEREPAATKPADLEAAESAAQQLVADGEKHYPGDLAGARVKAEEAMLKVPKHPRAQALLTKIEWWETQEKHAATAIAAAKEAVQKDDFNAAERALATVPDEFSKRADVIQLRDEIQQKRREIAAANEPRTTPAPPRPSDAEREPERKKPAGTKPKSGTSASRDVDRPIPLAVEPPLVSAHHLPSQCGRIHGGLSRTGVRLERLRQHLLFRDRVKGSARQERPSRHNSKSGLRHPRG